MSERWERRSLHELLEVLHGYPFASDAMSETLTGNPIIVSIGNFNYRGGFRFDSTRIREFTGDYPKQFELSPGDLLIAMTCQTPGGEILGLPGIVPDDGRTYLHNQRIGKVVVNPKVFDKRFAYYCFLSPAVNKQLVSTASGTKILHTAPVRIGAVQVAVPQLSEQRAIGALLGALDDKIAVNDRIARACHGLAQAHLSKARPYATLAPLSDIALITMGSSPPGESYNDDGIGMPFYQGTRDFGERFPGHRVWCTSPIRTASAGSTLVSVRAPVGRVNVAQELCCIGRGIASVKSSRSTPSVLYHTLAGASDVLAPYESEGTVFGAINKQQLALLQVPALEDEPALALEAILSPLDRRVASANEENRALAGLRDILLPKLMSGEIRVRDAEKVVEGAT